jgi:hypothetical protein
MLHSEAHNFQAVHDYFRLPFQQDDSNQDEMQMEGFRVLGDGYYLLDTGSRLAQIGSHVDYRIVPEREFTLATLFAIYLNVCNALAPRTELL